LFTLLTTESFRGIFTFTFLHPATRALEPRFDDMKLITVILAGTWAVTVFAAPTMGQNAEIE
jgi:hypothetical protein